MSLAALRRAVAAPPPPSAARAALAAAIAERDATQAKLTALRQAETKSYFATRAAREARDAAQRTADDAPRLAAQHAAALLMEDATDAPITPKAARAALADAEEAVTIAESVEIAVAGELNAAISSARLKDMRVNDAAFAVLRDESADAMQKLEAEADALKVRLLDIESAAAFWDLHIREAGRKYVSAEAPMPPPTPTYDAWRAAHEALKTDAAAVVP